MNTLVIHPDTDIITRVHYCPQCDKDHQPSSKEKGITPHYLVMHKVVGEKVHFWRACHICDCKKDRDSSGELVTVIESKHMDAMPIREWNACIIFNDSGY